eukprot:TRINITY_DN68279_c0_g1_i1.p1 TRINITY_DN68279_c0_g1~~TRINITY_DN68279_c0_g1_i1.p1  ORF type:complete len:645 (-),score=76.03 TRINITY_DN68279_c0_g1_i1:90-2024(-)
MENKMSEPEEQKESSSTTNEPIRDQNWSPPDAMRDDWSDKPSIAFDEEELEHAHEDPADTSQQKKSMEISRVGWMFFCWVLVVHGFIFYAKERVVVVLAALLAFIPALLFFVWFARTQLHVVEFDLVLRKFATGYAAWIMVFICQMLAFMVLSVPMDLVFYGIKHVNCDRCQDVWWIFAGAGAMFICFCVPEEALKYLLARRRTTRKVVAGTAYDPTPDTRLYAIYSLAVAIGYATMQNTFLVFAFAETPHGLTKGAALLVLSGLLCTFSTPMHTLTAYLIGLRIAKATELGERLNCWKVTWAPAAIRTLFITTLFLLLKMTAHFHWKGKISGNGVRVFLLFTAVVGIVGMLVLLRYIKLEFKNMPASYLAKSQYLDPMGYGALGYIDEEQPDEENQAQADSPRIMDGNKTTAPPAPPVGGVQEVVGSRQLQMAGPITTIESDDEFELNSPSPAFNQTQGSGTQQDAEDAEFEAQQRLELGIGVTPTTQPQPHSPPAPSSSSPSTQKELPPEQKQKEDQLSQEHPAAGSGSIRSATPPTTVLGTPSAAETKQEDGAIPTGNQAADKFSSLTINPPTATTATRQPIGVFPTQQASADSQTFTSMEFGDDWLEPSPHGSVGGTTPNTTATAKKPIDFENDDFDLDL